MENTVHIYFYPVIRIRWFRWIWIRKKYSDPTVLSKIEKQF